MSHRYPPEGGLLHTPANRTATATLAALAACRAEETVVEGRAVLCTPGHDLVVRLGPFTGTIPRQEAALGIREGTVREIAILSRVGKPVACTVTGVGEEGEVLLSRRRAQELALTALMALPAGTVLPAVVTHLEGFGAFVDVGCGVTSMIGIENCSVSRIAHPDRRFVPGQAIYALLTGRDRDLGRLYLSHKELLGTWAENAAPFRTDMTVPGIVRGVKEYGAFVELTPNLSGLAERDPRLTEGARVSVYLKAILPERMKIKLLVIEPLPTLNTPQPLHYFIREGRLEHWKYAPPGCVKVGMETIFGD